MVGIKHGLDDLDARCLLYAFLFFVAVPSDSIKNALYNKGGVFDGSAEVYASH